VTINTYKMNRRIRYLRKTEKLFIFVFLFFAFFFRTNAFAVGFLELKVSTLGFAYIALLFLFIFQIDFETNKITYTKLNRVHYMFLIVIIIVFILNIFVYPLYSQYTFMYFIEVFFNIMVFYYFFQVSASNPISSVHAFGNVLIAAAWIYPVPAVYYSLIGLESVRRIGAEDVPLHIAVNHLGQSLAIVTFILFVMVLHSNTIWSSKVLTLFIFITTLVATVLSGSRAAVFGLFISILFTLFLRLKKATIKTGIFILLTALIYLIFPISLEELISRFSFEAINSALMYRIGSFFEVAAPHINAQQFIFGVGWFKYQLYGVVDDVIIYPHNIILELFLSTGFVAAALLLYILIKEWYFLTVYLLKYKANSYYALMLYGALNITLFYSFSSGRLTRIVVIFCILGLSAGFRKWYKTKSQSYDQLEKV
jgi:O-antigen ligase